MDRWDEVNTRSTHPVDEDRRDELERRLDGLGPLPVGYEKLVPEGGVAAASDAPDRLARHVQYLRALIDNCVCVYLRVREGEGEGECPTIWIAASAGLRQVKPT
jgi:hypothetical protein